MYQKFNIYGIFVVTAVLIMVVASPVAYAESSHDKEDKGTYVHKGVFQNIDVSKLPCRVKKHQHGRDSLDSPKLHQRRDTAQKKVTVRKKDDTRHDMHDQGTYVHKGRFQNIDVEQLPCRVKKHQHTHKN